MPAPTPDELGPLAGLAGTWEGSKGLDVSYHNAEDEIGDTPYRERVTLAPFGPVDNGHQKLFGLDYRMAAWRGEEENPFHTEVGYWLWDAIDSQVFRCFVVPLNLDEDKYVTAVDFKPGNPKIVHHALFFLDATGTARSLDARDPEPGYPGAHAAFASAQLEMVPVPVDEEGMAVSEGAGATALTVRLTYPSTKEPGEEKIFM